MSGKEVSIEVEELHKRPTFQKAVKDVVDDYIQKGLSNKIWGVDVPDLDWIKGAKMYRTKWLHNSNKTRWGYCCSKWKSRW